MDISVCNLGPLLVLMPFLEQIGLQRIVDSQVPSTRHSRATHGQVLCALVLNRLMSPRSLYSVDEWSRHTAILDVLGLRAGDLNDDRLLRALDAIFPHLEALQGSLAWQVLERFELETSVLHWDLTSFFFEGAYEETHQDADCPQVNFGCPKKQDAGKHRKQMQVGFATSEDGGVPFWHRPLSGNSAEISQVGDVMESLKRLVRGKSFTLVGDTKLVSRKNMLKAIHLGLSFLAPEPRSREIAEEYLELRRTQRLTRLSYGRHRKRRNRRPHIYMGMEGSFTLEDPETGEGHLCRRLFILSAEERQATRRNRRRKCLKLYEEIAKIPRNLGKYSYKTPDDVRRRVDALLEKTKLQDCFIWSVEGEGRDMKLHFVKDPSAFRGLRQLDGMYTLVTNLGPEVTMDQLLERYKRQYLSEGRFRDLKGPLQLRPIFLKKNRRIVALVFVIYVALMVYCLIERTARQSLKQADETLPDPYTGRQLKEPTARRLLIAFEFYFAQVREVQGEREYLLPKPNAVQAKILRCLGIHEPLNSFN